MLNTKTLPFHINFCKGIQDFMVWFFACIFLLHITVFYVFFRSLCLRGKSAAVFAAVRAVRSVSVFGGYEPRGGSVPQ